jgi:hypothetical protein
MVTTSSVDAWELAGFPGRLNVAAYLTEERYAAQYRVIVDVLLDAQEHSLTGVSRDDLLSSVRDKIAAATDAMTAQRLTSPESFDIDARMRSLREWKVVDRWQDAARTEADFVRTRDRYQLTSEAADLHRWLRRKVMAAAQTLGSWFHYGPGQAQRLRRQVRDAVTPLLRGSRALQSDHHSPSGPIPQASKVMANLPSQRFHFGRITLRPDRAIPDEAQARPS